MFWPLLNNISATLSLRSSSTFEKLNVVKNWKKTFICRLHFEDFFESSSGIRTHSDGVVGEGHGQGPAGEASDLQLEAAQEALCWLGELSFFGYMAVVTR